MLIFGNRRIYEEPIALIGHDGFREGHIRLSLISIN